MKVIDRRTGLSAFGGIARQLFWSYGEVRLLFGAEFRADRGNRDDERVHPLRLVPLRAERRDQRVRIHGRTAARVELEVKVRSARSVTGIAHRSDLLTDLNVLTL